MTNTEFGNDIMEMMNAWNVIMTQARAQYPTATDEQLYVIAKSAMTYALQAKEVTA